MNPLLTWLRRNLESIGSWGYVGLLTLVTGATWVCPAYRVLGCSTAPRLR
jgi:DUF2892 family protein